MTNTNDLPSLTENQRSWIVRQGFRPVAPGEWADRDGWITRAAKSTGCVAMTVRVYRNREGEWTWSVRKGFDHVRSGQGTARACWDKALEMVTIYTAPREFGGGGWDLVPCLGRYGA